MLPLLWQLKRSMHAPTNSSYLNLSIGSPPSQRNAILFEDSLLRPPNLTWSPRELTENKAQLSVIVRKRNSLLADNTTDRLTSRSPPDVIVNSLYTIYHLLTHPNRQWTCLALLPCTLIYRWSIDFALGGGVFKDPHNAAQTCTRNRRTRKMSIYHDRTILKQHMFNTIDSL